MVNGVSYSMGAGLGVGANSIISLDGAAPATSASLGLGAGTPVEGHIVYANTQIDVVTFDLNTIRNNLKKAKDQVVEKVGELVDSVKKALSGGKGK